MSGRSLFVNQGYLLDINLSACAYKCEATRSVFAGRVVFCGFMVVFCFSRYLSLQADPHGGTDSNTTIAYNVTIVTNRAVKVDIGGKIMIIAG